MVWAEIIENVEVNSLQLLSHKYISTGSSVWSNTWKAYTGIAHDVTFFELSIKVKNDILTTWEIILMVFWEFWWYLKENYHRNVEFVEINSLYILRSTFRDTFINPNRKG
jgi:hypothetical protein